MKELVQKIESFIEIIDLYVTSMMLTDEEIETELQKLVVENLKITIPSIVVECMKEDPEDINGNISYWTNQLQCCIEALQSGDKFRQMDVLYYETRNTLKCIVESEN